MAWKTLYLFQVFNLLLFSLFENVENNYPFSSLKVSNILCKKNHFFQIQAIIIIEIENFSFELQMTFFERYPKTRFWK